MDRGEAKLMAELAVIKWCDGDASVEAGTAVGRAQDCVYKPFMGLTSIRPSLSVAALAGSRYIAASGKPLHCR